MDYKRMIHSVVDKLEDEKILKYIYNFIVSLTGKRA